MIEPSLLKIVERLQDTPSLEAFDEKLLAGIIDHLSEFDREMNSVVVESGILAGIPEGTLARSGYTTLPP